MKSSKLTKEAFNFQYLQGHCLETLFSTLLSQIYLSQKVLFEGFVVNVTYNVTINDPIAVAMACPGPVGHSQHEES